jgi:hypothetical protein
MQSGRGTLARVKRAGLIAAAVLGVSVLAGGVTWLVVFRDTAEPVTVGEAVTSFRTETEQAPSGPSPIPEGVYVYATTGFEKTDALTGVTHRYPGRSTMSVAAADCGFSLTWRMLKGRSTTWTICVADDGWELRSQDERHTFFGHTARTTYTCQETPIRTTQPAQARWPVSCATDDARERGVVRVVAGVSVPVAGVSVATQHVRKVTTFEGAIRGSSRYDFWFGDRDGLPVKIVMTTHTTNDSPVGAVHYEEAVALRLVSLEPRR